jgi:hypothetical protein
MPSAIVRIRVIICLLFLVSFNPILTPAAGAQPVAALPVLRSALTTSLSLGQIAVHGDGFTPGGLVSIVLYDRWGQDVYAPVRTVASVGQFGPNGSSDPAQGYVAPGTLSHHLDLTTDATYGPNGSADPAQGYVPGEAVAGTFACGQELMVRALDYRTSTWTNLLDFAAPC